MELLKIPRKKIKQGCGRGALSCVASKCPEVSEKERRVGEDGTTQFKSKQLHDTTCQLGRGITPSGNWGRDA